MVLPERLVALCVVVLASFPIQVLSSVDEIPLEVKQSLAAGRTAEALPWLTQAAEGGSAPAALYLGKLYLSGSGVPGDPDVARHYLQQSASGGVVEAQLMLGHLLQQAGDQPMARSWFEKAAASGSTRAAAWLTANPADSSKADPGDLFDRIETATPDLTGVGEDELNRRDAAGATPLIRAVMVQNSGWVSLLLGRKADVGAADHAGNSALHHASIRESSTILEALLKAGAPVNAKNRMGSTPLHAAVSQKQSANVEQLVTHGADPGIKDGTGWTAGMLAERLELGTSFSGRKENATGQRSIPEQGREADLFRVVHAGKVDVLQQMIGQGVEMKVVDADGNSPLQIAIGQEHADLVGPLIAAGVDVNVRNARGLSALMIAGQAADARSLALLLDSGADDVPADAWGRTALHHSVLSGCDACVKLLVKSGSDVTRQDRDGATPLLLALRESPALAAVLLRVSDAALQLRDKNGRDALWLAASTGNDQMAGSVAACRPGDARRSRRCHTAP